MFQSCEKETLTGTETAALAENEDFTVLPQLEDRPLSELHISFINGIPAFENTQHFLMVDRVVSHSSETEYLAWAEREGLTSVYHDYLKLAERVEANPEVPSQEQISKAESRFIFHMDEGGVAINHFLTTPKLTDQESRLYIGDDLHAFLPKNHILIDQGTPELLESIILNPVSDAENGIIIQPNGGDINPYSANHGDDKVAVKELNCPDIITNGFDGRFGRDTPVENWWTTYENSRSSEEIQDEQRVGCSRRRCRRGTRAFLLTKAVITELSDTRYNSVILIRYAFNNRRRNRFNWTRTFPTVSMDRGEENTPIMIRVQNQGTEPNGTIVTRSNDVFGITYPPLVAANGQGTAEEDYVLFSQTVTVNHPITDLPRALTRVSFIEGGIRHSWTSGSNNPLTDPISTEISCR